MAKAKLRILFVCLLMLCGCTVSLRDIPGGYEKASSEDAAALSHYLFSSDGGASPLNGRLHFSLDVSKSLGKERFRQTVVFARPDKLRVEIFATGLNQLAALITANEGMIEGFNVPEKTLYRGRASLENAGRLLTVPFTPEEAMLWFSGRFRFPQSFNLTSYSVFTNSEENRQLVIAAAADGRSIRLVVQPKDGGFKVESLAVFQKGNLVLSSTFVAGRQRKIMFELPESGVSGTLTVLEEAYGIANIQDRLFTLPELPGIPIVELDEQR